MSSSTKRHRPTGSQGHRSPPPLSAPGTILSEVIHGLESSFPSDREGELACPFVKHNPEAYKHVRNACTLTGYASISTLKEHIKRVHLLKYSCCRCNKRFTKKETELEDWKQTHECNSKKSRQESEVEITTKEQDDLFLKLDFRALGLTSGEAFKQIFLALWPKTPPADIPSGYIKPGFVLSMPELKAAIEEVEQRRLRSALLKQSQVAAQAGIPANMAQMPALLLSPSCTHWDCHQSFSFPGRCVANWDHSTGNITESGLHSASSDSIQDNRVHVPQGPVLPVSSHDLGTQQHPNTLSYDWKVSRGKGSTDSGYNTRELNEPDTALSAGLAAAAPRQGALESTSDFLSQPWPNPYPEFPYPDSYSQDLQIDDANEAGGACEVGEADELGFSHMGDLFGDLMY